LKVLIYMDVKLPPLGEGADSGTVVSLFVKEGDSITRDQPVLELENEKAVATIPSTASGTVGRVFVKVGDKVSVGQKIITVSGGGEPEAKAPRPASAPKLPDRSIEPAAEEPEEPAEAESAETQPQPGVAPAASPAIRRLARDLGIDLARVRGSARGGRIELPDLRAYIQRLEKLATRPGQPPAASAAARPPAESIDFSKWGNVTKKPFTPLRQVIARRMAESWNTVPHVTQFDEADITGLLALRKKHADAFDKQGARLTVTGFVLKAVVETLKQHPVFNSSLDEAAQEIVFKNYYHLGIAVDTEAGLIVPVIRDVDRKTLLELSRELETLAVKARERKVTGDELKGGTFTISNQGGIGGAHFTPIVNKPEVAILGLGRAATRPVARDGKVEIRTLLPLALSYDHRVIDGGAAARFVVDLVKSLENWRGEVE
jgi:pyruvate dehydrogenase E2 component (dihydrolipoamide acetyltransferase)